MAKRGKTRTRRRKERPNYLLLHKAGRLEYLPNAMAAARTTDSDSTTGAGSNVDEPTVADDGEQLSAEQYLAQVVPTLKTLRRYQSTIFELARDNVSATDPKLEATVELKEKVRQQQEWMINQLEDIKDGDLSSNQVKLLERYVERHSERVNAYYDMCSRMCRHTLIAQAREDGMWVSPTQVLALRGGAINFEKLLGERQLDEAVSRVSLEWGGESPEENEGASQAEVIIEAATKLMEGEAEARQVLLGRALDDAQRLGFTNEFMKTLSDAIRTGESAWPDQTRDEDAAMQFLQRRSEAGDGDAKACYQAALQRQQEEAVARQRDDVGATRATASSAQSISADASSSHPPPEAPKEAKRAAKRYAPLPNLYAAWEDIVYRYSRQLDRNLVDAQQEQMLRHHEQMNAGAKQIAAEQLPRTSAMLGVIQQQSRTQEGGGRSHVQQAATKCAIATITQQCHSASFPSYGPRPSERNARPGGFGGQPNAVVTTVDEPQPTLQGCFELPPSVNGITVNAPQDRRRNEDMAKAEELRLAFEAGQVEASMRAQQHASPRAISSASRHARRSGARAEGLLMPFFEEDEPRETDGAGWAGPRENPQYDHRWQEPRTQQAGEHQYGNAGGQRYGFTGERQDQRNGAWSRRDGDWNDRNAGQNRRDGPGGRHQPYVGPDVDAYGRRRDDYRDRDRDGGGDRDRSTRSHVLRAYANEAPPKLKSDAPLHAVDFFAEMDDYVSSHQLTESEEAWSWLQGAGKHGADLRQELHAEQRRDPGVIAYKLLKVLLPETVRAELRDSINSKGHNPSTSITEFERRLRQLCRFYQRPTSGHEYVELLVSKMQPKMKAHLREKERDERHYMGRSLTRERTMTIAREFEESSKASTNSYSSARVAAVRTATKHEIDPFVDVGYPSPPPQRVTAQQWPKSKQQELERLAAAFIREESECEEEVESDDGYSEQFGFFGTESALEDEACCHESDTAYVRAVSVATKCPEQQKSYSDEEFTRRVKDYLSNHRVCSQCGGNHEFDDCHANPKCKNRPPECRFCKQHHLKECADESESKKRLDTRIFIFARGRMAWAEARARQPAKQFSQRSGGNRSGNRFSSQGSAGRSASSQQGNAQRRA